MGRLDGLGSKTTQVAVALIIDKDDDEVGGGRTKRTGQKDEGGYDGEVQWDAFHKYALQSQGAEVKCAPERVRCIKVPMGA